MNDPMANGDRALVAQVLAAGRTKASALPLGGFHFVPSLSHADRVVGLREFKIIAR